MVNLNSKQTNKVIF